MLSKVSERASVHVDYSPEKHFPQWTALHYAAASGLKAKVPSHLCCSGWSPTLKRRMEKHAFFSQVEKTGKHHSSTGVARTILGVAESIVC